MGLAHNGNNGDLKLRDRHVHDQYCIHSTTVSEGSHPTGGPHWLCLEFRDQGFLVLNRNCSDYVNKPGNGWKFANVRPLQFCHLGQLDMSFAVRTSEMSLVHILRRSWS